MNVKKILGQNISKYRKKKGMTQEELSEKLDISAKHLSNIEMGNNFVSAPLLEKISKFLKVSPSALFYSLELNKIDDNAFGKIDEILTEEMTIIKKRIREEIN